MKWINHQIITTSLAFAMTQSISFTLGAFVGSTLPDKLEGNFNKQITFQNHRQLTHWFVPYAITFIILLSIVLIVWPLPTGLNLFSKVTLGGLFGCLAHIAEDAVTGTVPGIQKEQRIGKAYIQPHSYQEYIVSFICFLIACIVFILTGLTVLIQGDIF